MRIVKLLALATACVSAGCYGYGTVGYGTVAAPTYAVEVAPPAPLYETPTPSPALGTVWIGGYWDYNPPSRRYVWVPGHWTTPPRQGVVYVPPSWVRGPRGYLRVEGRWIAGRSIDRYGRRVYYDAGGRAHYF
jgi:hypothetical protein